MPHRIPETERQCRAARARPERPERASRSASAHRRRLYPTGVLALAAACGGTPSTIAADPTVTPPIAPLPLAQAFVLESWGGDPEDTTVVFAAAEGRVIVLRRNPPDNSIYARISFPPGSVAPRQGDSVRVTLRPRPGLYAIELTTDAAEIREGAEMTFSYAIHFVAPAEARVAYGSEYRFERFLGVARLEGDSTLVFQDSWRPASDLLTAPLLGPGRYLVAAPRSAPQLRSIIW